MANEHFSIDTKYKNWIQDPKLTFLVMLSAHAILIHAAVAGASNGNQPSIPDSFRAAATADLIAKNTDAERKSGGSPEA